ncbi:MAG: hypothetical protein L0Z53_26310 [Acidobacteriales bacterium]|nr:hypothetical protein [Terriglobales bacterium]
MTGGSATVSVITDLAPARSFLDPPVEGGPDVAYVVIGIRNNSKQSFTIDPSQVTLRVIGKKEKELERLDEKKVIARAWQASDRTIGAVPPMGTRSVNTRPRQDAGMNDATRDMAVSHRQLGRSDRRVQEASEQQTGVQLVRLQDRALLVGDLDPGKSIMGMVFFYPYEKKDQLELTILVGETTFVIPCSGKKK